MNGFRVNVFTTGTTNFFFFNHVSYTLSQKSNALTDSVKIGGKGVFNLTIMSPKNYGQCGATIEYNPIPSFYFNFKIVS